jgi:lysine-N-methylase
MYKTLEGPLGDELREKIDFNENGGSFILGEGDRCPFLNGQGLCRLILGGGEHLLCDICREHPRFYNQLPSREEMGLGLGCEEAARLILTDSEMGALYRYGEEDCGEAEQYEIDECEELLAERDSLIGFLTDEEIPLENRVLSIADTYGINGDDCLILSKDILDFMAELEPLDHTWEPNMRELSASLGSLPAGREERAGSLCSAGGERAYVRLAVYFIYRYFVKAMETGCAPAAYVGFALLSTELIALRCCLLEAHKGRALTEEEICTVAADYSNQIEYCTENVEAIVDRFLGILG